jgi:hypothetical protein
MNKLSTKAVLVLGLLSLLTPQVSHAQVILWPGGGSRPTYPGMFGGPYANPYAYRMTSPYYAQQPFGLTTTTPWLTGQSASSLTTGAVPLTSGHSTAFFYYGTYFFNNGPVDGEGQATNPFALGSTGVPGPFGLASTGFSPRFILGVHPTQPQR